MIKCFARSFHDKFHIGSMGMNIEFKVDSHFSKCIPFHSLLAFDEVVVLKVLPGEIPDESDP